MPTPQPQANPSLSSDGIDGPPIEAVYPEIILVPVIGARRVIIIGIERIGKAAIRIFRDPISVRPKGVPKEWVKMLSKKNKGYRYRKPGQEKFDDIRVQKGDPKSQYPNSQKDYVRWKKDGQWLDKDGKPSLDESEAHIPLNKSKFNLDVYKMKKRSEIFKHRMMVVLKELSDKSYQERVWAGGNCNIGDLSITFTEAAIILFDDALVTYALEEGAIIYDKKVIKALRELSDALDAVEDIATQ